MSDEQTNELYLLLFSIVVLKGKQVLDGPLVFKTNLTNEVLLNSRAYVSAIAQNEYDTLRQKTPSNILKNNEPLNFQIQVANSQQGKLLATATLKFDIGDNTSAEHFVVMRKLTGLIVGLHFMRNYNVALDTTYELMHFRHLTMLFNTASCETNTKPQVVLIDDALTIPSRFRKTITAFVDYPSDWTTTSTVTPSLLNSHSLSTIIDQRITFRVTKTTESPFSFEKNTLIVEFSVETAEQSKCIKPGDLTILSMIPEGVPDLTTYLNERLRTNKPEQQSNTLVRGSHRISNTNLHNITRVERKRETQPTRRHGIQTKFHERFDWTDLLLTEAEKQAFEENLVEYHDFFARHRIDIGMNTEFRVKLNSNDGKVVFSHSVPMPTHMKKDLTVELALKHKYAVITVVPFSKYASPIFAQRKHNGKLPLPVEHRKFNSLIVDDYTDNNRPVSTFSDAAQLRRRSLYSAN